MGASQAKQRFMHLDVTEVSLVDVPANAEDFITTKSMKTEEPTVATNEESKLAARTVEFNAAVSEMAVVTKCLATINILKGLKDGAPPDKSGDKVYTADGMLDQLKALCSDKSMPPELATKLKAMIEKGLPPWLKGKTDKKDDEPDGDEKDTKKAVGDGVGDPHVELIHKLLMFAISTLNKVSMLVDMDMGMPDLGEAVTKGMKQFTDEHISQLKAATGAMVALLKELDPAHLSALGISVASSAAAKQPSGGVDGASGAPSTPVIAPSSPAGDATPNLPAGPAQGQSSAASDSGVAVAIKKALDEALKPLAAQLAATKAELVEVTKAKVDTEARMKKMETTIIGTTKSLAEQGTEGKPVEKKVSLFSNIL